MKSQEKVVCEICGEKYKNFNGLTKHFSQIHKIKSKDYYDIYLKKEGEGEGICKECGKETKYFSINNGYREFCSLKCSSNSKYTKEKRKQTYKEKHGYNHQMHNPKVKDRIKQTNLEKYGCENVLQNDKIKKRIKQTNLEKYGCENVFKSEKIKDKIKEYWIDNFGVDNPNQLEKIRNKIENTNLEKYGVKHHSQNKEIHRKQHNFKFKDYDMPSGDIRKVQGYEHLALNILIEIFDESDILTHKGVPTIKYYFEEKNKVYFPDIYIPSENLIIEVKSKYTYERYLDKNLTKQQACLDKGYNFEFWIFDDKGKLIFF